VWAGLGVAQKRANPLVELGADDVFELTGLIVSFRVIDRESVFEQTFGEAVAADHVAGAKGACARAARR
jgi:hypothetical protein